MELRKEYEAIRSRAIQGLCVPANQVTVGTVIDAVREAVTACQELADRPPRELTDAEIQNAWMVRERGNPLTRVGIEAIRNCIAAFLAKQREPATLKFRVARHKSHKSIQLFPSDFVFQFDEWEWLDADGKAQEFEVKV